MVHVTSLLSKIGPKKSAKAPRAPRTANQGKSEKAKGKIKTIFFRFTFSFCLYLHADPNLLGELADGSAKQKSRSPKPYLKLILGALGALAFSRFVYLGQH
jgi:hypothetical protein